MQLHERATLKKKNKKFMYTVYFVLIIIKSNNKSNNNYCNKISITGCVMFKLLLTNINIVI